MCKETAKKIYKMRFGKVSTTTRYAKPHNDTICRGAIYRALNVKRFAVIAVVFIERLNPDSLDERIDGIVNRVA